MLKGWVLPTLGDALLEGIIFGMTVLENIIASSVNARNWLSPMKSGVDGDGFFNAAMI